MKSKIILETKGKLENTEKFKLKVEQEIEEYLNNGYKIQASNMTSDGMYGYIYVLLIKE